MTVDYIDLQLREKLQQFWRRIVYDCAVNEAAVIRPVLKMRAY